MVSILHPTNHETVLGRDGRMSRYRKQDFIIDLPDQPIGIRELEKNKFPVFDTTGPKKGWKKIGDMTTKEFLEKFG